MAATNGSGFLTPIPNSASASGTSTPAGSALAQHSITDPVELWRHADPESTQMYEFKMRIEHKYGLTLDHYEDLHKWSVGNIGAFWSEVWDYVGVQGEKGAGEVGYHLLYQLCL